MYIYFWQKLFKNNQILFSITVVWRGVLIIKMCWPVLIMKGQSPSGMHLRVKLLKYFR